ncbi:MAG: peptidase M17 [Archangium sp.]|nr:peptidase M17 [Archangium sp.]
MKPTLLDPGLSSLDALTGCESVCALVLEDERPLQGAVGFLDWRLCGALSRALKSGFFSGQPGEKLLLPSEQRISAGRVFAIGVGKRAGVTQLGLEHALSTAATMLTKAGATSAALALPRLALEDEVVAGVVKRAFLQSFGTHVTLFAEKAIQAHVRAG